MTYISTFSNVLYATESMVVAWMKSPQKFSVTKASAAFKCSPTVDLTKKCPSTLTHQICTYTDSNWDMNLCATACPATYLNIRTLLAGDKICQYADGMSRPEDCKSSDCPACTGPFISSTNKITVTDSWDGGMCVEFTSGYAKTTANKGNNAISYYMILKYCNSDITAFWGGIDDKDAITTSSKVTSGGKTYTQYITRALA